MECPYTGEEFTVANNGGLALDTRVKNPKYFILVGLFNPLTKFDSEAEAISALCLRRKGVILTKENYTCPYSGKKFTINQHPVTKKWLGRGLVSPARNYVSKEEAIYAASFRGGRKPKTEQFPKKIVPSIKVTKRVEKFDDFIDTTKLKNKIENTIEDKEK